MILTVPCLLGLESLVADELRRLNMQNVRAENGRLEIHTIDDAPAVGVCGSGLIDAVAAALSLG